MNTSIDCIPCFLQQSIDAIRSVTDDDNIRDCILKKVLLEVYNFDFSKSPPEMAQVIHKIIRDETQNEDPYKDVKNKSNQFALGLYDETKEKIIKSDDPFNAALRFAIAGNILDFAVISKWNKKRALIPFEKAIMQRVDDATISELFLELKKADSVLFLGDNVGEIVFDKLFIEQFPKDVKIYFAVKEAPIINDATLEDAYYVGIDEVAEVISNGTDAPGTVLSQCSQEFLSIYERADIVIAKGQANFETLNKEQRKIYFLTQIKCAVMAKLYNYSVGDWIVATSDKLNKMKEK